MSTLNLGTKISRPHVNLLAGLRGCSNKPVIVQGYYLRESIFVTIAAWGISYRAGILRRECVHVPDTQTSTEIVRVTLLTDGFFEWRANQPGRMIEEIVSFTAPLEEQLFPPTLCPFILASEVKEEEFALARWPRALVWTGEEVSTLIKRLPPLIATEFRKRLGINE